MKDKKRTFKKANKNGRKSKNRFQGNNKQRV